MDKSTHFGKHVPRGELVELLSKALLYSEVEAHWRGNAMTTNCKTPFTLLEHHVCSLDPTLPPTVHFNPPPPSEIPIIVNGANGTAEKRKASTPASEETPNQKRARTEEMEVDSVSSVAERTFVLFAQLLLQCPVRPFSRRVSLRLILQRSAHRWQNDSSTRGGCSRAVRVEEEPIGGNTRNCDFTAEGT